MNDQHTSLQRGLEAQLRTIIDNENIIIDQETQKPYECDGLSIYCEMPLIIVLPETVDQVCAVMKICHKLQVPVVARGAGTGLCAGAMPHKEGVLLSLAKLNKILEIDIPARLARVQPGVSNLSISHAVAEQGFYYGPDPSSQIAC